MTPHRLRCIPPAFGLVLLLLAPPVLAEDAPGPGALEVVVTGFPSDEGVARIRLARGRQAYEAKEDESEGIRSASAPIAGGHSSWTFRELPYGEYAVKVFHDANRNEKLDTNFMRVPRESYGFSNDPPRRLGPAKYEDAKFAVDTASVRIEIELLPPPF